MNWQRYPFSSAFNSRPDQHQILCFGDEVQLGQGVDLLAADAGLACKGEAGQRPVLGQASALDSPRQRGFLTMMPLCPQQPGEELGIGDILLLAAPNCSP